MRTLFFALLFGATQGAWAQFKCVSPEGKVTYSQSPCAAGSKPGAVRPGAAATFGTPARISTTYYDVQGGDFSSLMRALNARGPHHGRADWKLSYKYRWRQAGGGCAVESLNTELELAMTLPRWTPPANVEPGLVQRWERYLAALCAHEEGHLDHGRGAERELLAFGSGMQAADCGALDNALRQRFASILADYQKRDKDYDARTGHGKSQGAYFQ